MKCPVCRATYKKEAKKETASAISDLQNPQIPDFPPIPFPSSSPSSPSPPSSPSSSPLPPAPVRLSAHVETCPPASLSPCKRCGADLSALIQLRDRAIWHYRRAIQFLQQGDAITAQLQVQQAIALHFDNADFHAFAGQLWAMQGEFHRAAIAWKQAQRLDAKHPLATGCLQIMAELIPN